MKKSFSVGVLIVCITLLLSACGDRKTNYIKKYSKELKKALGDYTFVEKKSKRDFIVDGTSFWTTKYLEWQITYTAPDGSTQTFTLDNLDDDKWFYSQMTEECIRNIESEVKGIATKEGWTDGRNDGWRANSMDVFIHLDAEKKGKKFMLYPAYTDLKTLTSKYDCTINLEVYYDFDVDKFKKMINQLIAHCGNKVNLRVYCDLFIKGDVDAFDNGRFVDIYLYKKGKCTLENLHLFKK